MFANCVSISAKYLSIFSLKVLRSCILLLMALLVGRAAVALTTGPRTTVGFAGGTNDQTYLDSEFHTNYYQSPLTGEFTAQGASQFSDGRLSAYASFSGYDSGCFTCVVGGVVNTSLQGIIQTSLIPGATAGGNITFTYLIHGSFGPGYHFQDDIGAYMTVKTYAPDGSLILSPNVRPEVSMRLIDGQQPQFYANATVNSTATTLSANTSNYRAALSITLPVTVNNELFYLGTFLNLSSVQSITGEDLPNGYGSADALHTGTVTVQGPAGYIVSGQEGFLSNVLAVPEPSRWILASLGLGFLGLCNLARRSVKGA